MQQVHTAKIVQQAHTADTSGERDQWRKLPDEPSTSRSAWQARSRRDPEQPARDERTPVPSETSGASYRTSRVPAGPRGKRAQEGTQSSQRGASGHQPAERDQWRELPDEPGASGSARRVRAEANQSSGKAPEGQARGESQTLGGARYERRKGVRGRPNAAGHLTQKLPSPALKEAERSGSYNPGDLNTLTGGTVRNGTVQGHIAGGAAYAVPCESTWT